MRIDMPNEPGAFGLLANAIGDAGGAIGAVDMHTGDEDRASFATSRSVCLQKRSRTEVRKAVEAIDGARDHLRHPIRPSSRISAERSASIRRFR